MRYFIAILPSENYTKQITTFLEKWNRYNSETSVPPHITIKTQGGLNKDEQWIETVRYAAKNFHPFFVTINTPSSFKNNSIIYLQVESDPIKELHKKLIESLELYGEELEKWYEGGYYTPHLTLASLDLGYTQEELLNVKKEAVNIFTSHPSFQVKTITIFKQVTDTEPYTKLIDIPLGK